MNEMKHIKAFNEMNTYKIDTRTIKGIKATEVADYFDRHEDVYHAGAQFIDFDEVELTLYDTDDMSQEDIDDKLDSLEDVIFNAGLKKE